MMPSLEHHSPKPISLLITHGRYGMPVALFENR